MEKTLFDVLVLEFLGTINTISLKIFLLNSGKFFRCMDSFYDFMIFLFWGQIQAETIWKLSFVIQWLTISLIFSKYDPLKSWEFYQTNQTSNSPVKGFSKTRPECTIVPKDWFLMFPIALLSIVTLCKVLSRVALITKKVVGSLWAAFRRKRSLIGQYCIQ